MRVSHAGASVTIPKVPGHDLVATACGRAVVRERNLHPCPGGIDGAAGTPGPATARTGNPVETDSITWPLWRGRCTSRMPRRRGCTSRAASRMSGPARNHEGDPVWDDRPRSRRPRSSPESNGPARLGREARPSAEGRGHARRPRTRRTPATAAPRTRGGRRGRPTLRSCQLSRKRPRNAVWAADCHTTG